MTEVLASALRAIGIRETAAITTVITPAMAARGEKIITTVFLMAVVGVGTSRMAAIFMTLALVNPAVGATLAGTARVVIPATAMGHGRKTVTLVLMVVLIAPLGKKATANLVLVIVATPAARVLLGPGTLSIEDVSTSAEEMGIGLKDTTGVNSQHLYSGVYWVKYAVTFLGCPHSDDYCARDCAWLCGTAAW